MADERDEIIAELTRTIEACVGYMLNARIDLETGATKATAIRTIDGGIKMAHDALERAKEQTP